jgi:biopolymer transport protein ExbD
MKGAAKHDPIETDMTPMIDVTFQLIIFFICTIKFKTLEGKLETQLPKDVGVNPSDAESLVEKAEIHMNVDRSRPEGFQVALNGQVVPNLETLSAKVRQLKQQLPEMKATLYPNRGITYEHVVKVVDACIKADMYDITFAGVAFDA